MDKPLHIPRFKKRNWSTSVRNLSSSLENNKIVLNGEMWTAVIMNRI